MTSKTGEVQIFKVDRRGRVHVPEARREALLDEFERSGVSAAEFARLAGLRYATFANWRAKRLRRRALALAGSRTAMPLFEAVLEPPVVAGSVEGLVVELPGGGRLRLSAASQVAWAAELLRLLGTTGCRPC